MRHGMTRSGLVWTLLRLRPPYSDDILASRTCASRSRSQTRSVAATGWYPHGRSSLLRRRRGCASPRRRRLFALFSAIHLRSLRICGSALRSEPRRPITNRGGDHGRHHSRNSRAESSPGREGGIRATTFPWRGLAIPEQLFDPDQQCALAVEYFQTQTHAQVLSALLEMRCSLPMVIPWRSSSTYSTKQ
jgi:hypothetical protein